MESSLVQSHVAGGRLYPRPKAACDHCSSEVILCWGDKVKIPYWRHPASVKSDGHQASCESATHKLAKKLLRQYLAQGGKCVYLHGCHSDREIADEGCVKFIEEYTYKDVRWDIGCLSVDDKLLFGIEIRVTHAVNKIATRDEVPWVELGAYEVLSMLDRTELPPTITLMNLSTTEECCLKKLTLKSIVFNEIARKLGFLVDIPSEQYDVIHTIAMQGKTYTYEEWRTKGNPAAYQSDVAIEFISRMKCLRCEGRIKEVTCYKPYCGCCYHAIANDKADNECKVKVVDPTLKLQIRGKMGWMNLIPASVIPHVEPCSMCKGTHNSTTWWFGEHKTICCKCFDAECRKRGMYEMLPSRVKSRSSE